MNPLLVLSVFVWWLLVLLFLLKKKVSLGSSILVMALGMSLTLGRTLRELLDDAWQVTIDPQVLELLAVVMLIQLFSFLLQKTHRMERIVSFLTGVFRQPRWILVSVPALVGLIPMPGGAMFTAPLTEAVGNRIHLSPEAKVFSNYWFRHCWELAFPLYPGIILASGLMKIPAGNLALVLLPLALIAFFSGIVVFFRQAEKITDADKTGSDEQGLEKWTVLWPILSVVVVALCRVPLIPGLIGIILLVVRMEGISFPDTMRAIQKSLQVSIIILIWAVFFFGRELQECQVLLVLSELMLRMGLPIGFLSFSLPFAMGLLTGVTTGFVGTVFPLLIPLWGTDWSAWVPLAYASGLAGVFLTPAHLCLSMTQEYFHASLKVVILQISVPVIIIVASALLTVFL